MPIIEATNIVKTFTRTKRIEGRLGSLRTLFTRQRETTTAISGVSFSIDRGEIVGYLGPNGSGKSTTVKLLTGILVPTSGQVKVAGITPWQQRERNARNIGVVFGQRTGLWWDLPLDESFRIIATMYRMDPQTYRHNLDHLTKLLELHTFLSTPVRQLSLGQRMRGDLAAALLYDPPILFLDEPTIGLDLIAKERIRSLIEQINHERKTTILLTTHDLDDVSRLCSRVILLDSGSVQFDGAISTLKKQFHSRNQIRITLRSDSDLSPLTLNDIHLSELAMTSCSANTVNFTFDPERITPEQAITQIASKLPIASITMGEPDLEDIMRSAFSQSKEQ